MQHYLHSFSRRLPGRLLLPLAVLLLTTALSAYGQTAQSPSRSASAPIVIEGTAEVAPASGTVFRATGVFEQAAEKLNKVAEEKATSVLGAWTKREIGGVAIWRGFVAFLLLLLGLIGRKVSDHLFEVRLIPLFRRSRFSFDVLLAEAMSSPVGCLLLLFGFAGAFSVLDLPEEPNIKGFLFGVLKVVFVADLSWFLFRSVNVAVAYLESLASKTDSRLDDQLIPLVRKAMKVTIAVIGFVWVAQLLDYDVSALLAGLGIGGLAVALALQDALSNFFGSIFIFLDRPFIIGDWIKVEDAEGVVEEIGFRSTRIRTFPKTLITVPNRSIASASINNFSRMPKRRVKQVIGVTYETTAAQMEAAVAAIRGILAADDGVDKEFYMVRFTDFGSSSLDIMLYYFTSTTIWDEYLGIRERVNLTIMKKLEELGLSIAFSTQTVYFEGEVARGMLGKK